MSADWIERFLLTTCYIYLGIAILIAFLHFVGRRK